jgi:hypothetical protein
MTADNEKLASAEKIAKQVKMYAMPRKFFAYISAKFALW